MKNRTCTTSLTIAAACLSTALPLQTAMAQRSGDGSTIRTERRAAAIPVPAGGRRKDVGRTSPDSRSGERPAAPPPGGEGSAFEFPREFRRIDAYGNNEENPEWGMAHSYYLRLVVSDYADGVGQPSGANRPNARAISNAVAAQSGERPNAVAASDFFWQWGQFIDHDIDETPTANPAEAFDIGVPRGDVFFDPNSTGDATIGLNRSDYGLVGGIRQQINAITAYIDASNVYGSDEQRAFALRELDGSGRLRASEGDLLPFNTEGLANAPSASAASFYLAGDVRANEQAGRRRCIRCSSASTTTGRRRCGRRIRA